MAKILKVELVSIPEVIKVFDNIDDITVETTIQFHKQDIDLKMDYCLHLFVFDIQGEEDAPLILPNWDESSIIPISLGLKDDYLGQAKIILTADKSKVVVKTPMALRLVKSEQKGAYFSGKFEVFATIAPIIGRASKWSESFESQVLN